MTRTDATRRRISRARWRRCAVLGLLWCAVEREQRWRENFYRADALLRDFARELGPLKALTSDPLWQRARTGEA